MKVVGLVLGLMMASACSGDPSEPGAANGGDADVSTEALTATGASLFEPLHHGHGRDHGAHALAVRRAIAQGAVRLAALQADITGDNAHNGLTDTDPDDGGWDFTLPATATAHTATASPTNLFGETGLGEWAAVDSGIAGPRALVAALDAGTGMQRNADVDSPPDFAFGVLLAELADNPGFAEVARQHYDAKRAAFGGATGLGTFIRDGRHARKEDGLIPYDVGWLALSASALDVAFPGAGYGADAATYAGIVVADLKAAQPDFDIDDPTEGFYVIGLAWAQVDSAFVGDRALFRQVRGKLLDQQHANGAWGTSATQPADDLQSTAIALETLAITDHAGPRAALAERRTTRFLLAGQASTGGWPDANHIELPLVDAEIMLGLALSHTDAGDDDPASPFEVAHATLAPSFAPSGAPVAAAQPAAPSD